MQFLASKTVFTLWYPFQKRQPEGAEGLNHQGILGCILSYTLRWLRNWKLPIDLDWLWRKAIYSRTQYPRHAWGESHIPMYHSLKLHGVTNSDSEVIGGSLHMVCEPWAERATLVGVANVCAELWSQTRMLSSHGVGTHEVSSLSRLGQGAGNAGVIYIPKITNYLRNGFHKN